MSTDRQLGPGANKPEKETEWTVVDDTEPNGRAGAESPSDGHRQPGASPQEAWEALEEMRRYAQAEQMRRAQRERDRPTWRFMLSHPAHVFSLGFGSGLSRIMPGTAGTLAGWLIFALLYPHLSTRAWLVLIVVGFVAGIWATDFTARRMKQPDPGAVVWDEIIAIWIVLLYAMPTGFWGQFWCFIVFRFFDMVKPPPIRYFDRRLKGGFGIMFDDIVAALFSVAIIALFR